jgi:protein dithiol oxidoreductase (disulfide-forming)
MPISKGVLAWVCAALLALSLTTPVLAQQEGTDYRKVSPPQPIENPGKIEVTEFFSYGCPHCNEFYPLLKAWLAQQKPDVVLRRVPVGFERPPWENLQRAFYALKASGDLEKLDSALFDAIHEKHQMLFDESSLVDWVGKNGGNATKFATAYTSFSVNNDTVQADKMAQDYGVDAVPTIAVNGEYVALGDSHAEILNNTSKLIAKVRAERAARGKAAK